MPDEPPSTEAIRGEVRSRGYRRVTHGLFLPEVEGLSDDAEFIRDLKAWRVLLPPDARFTHLTGARVRGWDLPPLPEGVPVFASTRHGTRGARRPGLLLARLTHDCAVVAGDSPVPTDAPEEILLRAARDLGVVDLVVLIASAIRLNDLDLQRLEEVLKSRRPGVRRLRAAYELARHRTESAGETLLGLMHDVIEVPVEAQVEVRTPRGYFAGRADFAVLGTPFLHEYDGAVHRAAGQHARDLRRDRALAEAGRTRRGFVLADLTTHAAVTIHEIDRALGRPHDPKRIRRWGRLTEHSLYSPEGRQRLMNRWRRAMGVVEWSRDP